MNDESKKASPAYTTYKTLTNFVDALGPDVPSQIDRSLMSSMSGSAQGATLSSLRFLKLVEGKDDEPTDLLHRLSGSEGADRKAAIKEMVEGAYDIVSGSDIDLKRATAAQVNQWFRDQGVRGATVDRAVTFFINAAQEAEIELSKHLTEKKRSSPTASGNRRKAPKKKKSKVKKRPPAGSSQFDVPLPGKGTASIILPKTITRKDWDDLLSKMFALHVDSLVAARDDAESEHDDDDDYSDLV